MKLICSLLILAGAIALNDAFVSVAEQQMRLARDQMKLQGRIPIDARNPNSAACSAEYLKQLTEVLNVYNAANAACTSAKETAIEGYQKEAKAKLDGYGSGVSGECSGLGQCASIEDPAAAFDCYTQSGSASGSQMTLMSADATKAKVDMQQNIENANGLEVVCSQAAYSVYTQDSDKCDRDFNDCLNGKSPAPTPAPVPTPETTTTTEAPAPPEGRARVAHRPYVYQRS